MQRGWLIAIIAGLVSALLFLSMLAGNVLSLLLVYLLPLPLIIAGLGWGSAVSAMAAVTGTLFLFIVMNVTVGVIFALTCAMPPVLLSRFALRHRDGRPEIEGGPERESDEEEAMDAGEPAEEADPEDWYPVGRLVTWIAVMALGLFVLANVAFTSSEGGLVPTLEAALHANMEEPKELLDDLKEAGQPMTKDELYAVAAQVFPSIAAVLWCVIMVLNLALGQAIVKVSGQARRADFDWLRLELPFGLAIALSVTLLMGYLPSQTGFIGATSAVILSAPYFLAGLITAHGVSAAWVSQSGTPGMTGGLRFSGLALMYLMLMVMQGLAAQLITLLGILDQWFEFRRRFMDHPAPEEIA